MLGKLKLILLLAFVALLPAMQCHRPAPTPGVGGSPGAGGAASGGAVSFGGALVGGTTSLGGSTAQGGVSVVPVTTVAFPQCNPPTHKVAPIDRSKLKLGRKLGALSKARKASYVEAQGVHSTFWAPLIPDALDQGSVGACTGFAAVQARLSKPFSLFTLPAPFGERTTVDEFNLLALDIYSGATKRDPWPGVYPPTDTGSNGESALSVAVERGLVGGFVSVGTLAELQVALQSGPCIGGFDWYDGMFSPTNCGQISPTGAVAGGHEIAIVGLDVDDKVIWLENSWDNPYGVSFEGHGGYVNVTYGTVSKWLAAGGEIECLR